MLIIGWYKPPYVLVRILNSSHWFFNLRNYGSDEKQIIIRSFNNLIMSMIYSHSSKQYTHRQGINQILYQRRDVCDQQLMLDVDSSKISQPLKRTFLLDAVDEKEAPRLNC